MVDSQTGIEEMLAFFDKVVDMTYGQIQEVLEGQEWRIFKYWLSMYDVERATYELERARVRIILGRRSSTIAEIETRLPIDDTLKLWNDLIEDIGGTQDANDFIMGAAFCGHFVR